MNSGVSGRSVYVIAVLVAHWRLLLPPVLRGDAGQGTSSVGGSYSHRTAGGGSSISPWCASPDPIDTGRTTLVDCIRGALGLPAAWRGVPEKRLQARPHGSPSLGGLPDEEGVLILQGEDIGRWVQVRQEEWEALNIVQRWLLGKMLDVESVFRRAAGRRNERRAWWRPGRGA